MRLTSYQQATIKKMVAEVFGAEVSVHLFGSRVLDEAKGGDIDLLIVSPNVVVERVKKIARLVAKLQLILGERKFDVVVKDPSVPTSVFFQRITDSAVTL